MNRELATAARRFMDSLSERLTDLPTSRLFRATVTTVVPGGASDGNALVKVSWRGNELTVADYGAHYTPVEGHRVVCALFDDQITVIQRSIGQP